MKNIHFMWLDKTNPSGEIPDKYIPYLNTWYTYNSDWNIKIWNTTQVLELINNNFSNTELTFFENIDPFISKCDFARFLIIYIYGGLYVDLDFICKKNITPLINSNETLFWRELPEHLYNNSQRIYVGIFYAQKNNPFIDGFIKFMMNNYHKNNNVLKNTGPIALSNYHKISPYKINFGNPCDINPFTDKQVISKICNKGVIDPYCYTLWKDASTTVKNNNLSNNLSLPKIDTKRQLLPIVISLIILILILYYFVRNKFLLFFISVLIIALIVNIIRENYIVRHFDKLSVKLNNNNVIDIIPTEYLYNTNEIPKDLINKKYMFYNPSLVKIKDQKYIWIRKSSYFLCTNGTSTKGNVNQHLFAKLSDDNQLILESQIPLILPVNKNIYKNTNITIKNEKIKYYGVEDIRLTYDKKRDILILTGTYPFLKNHEIKASIYYAEFNYHTYTILYETLLFTDFDDKTKSVKNIIPLYKDDNLHFIFTLFPYVLTKPNFENNTITLIKKNEYKLPFNLPKHTHISGGSTALSLGDFYLGIGHLRTMQSKRSYKHFFYLLDKDCNIIAYTKNSFCLGKDTCRIQFALGLIFDKNQVLISYGDSDCSTHLIYYKFSDIFKAMIPINQTSCRLKKGVDRPQFCILGFFNLLLAVTYVLKEANIMYWIDFGTLLGAVRGNYIIRYTNDVDISILDKDKYKAREALKSLDDYIETKKHEYSNHAWYCCTSKIISSISLDIAFRVENDNKLYDGSIKDDKLPINIEDVFPLSELYIYGFKFSAPKNSKNILKIYYGENFLEEDRYKHAGS